MAGVDLLATAFNGGNAAFLADLYARWVADPAAVDPSFATLFGALDEESVAVLQDASGASWAPRQFEVERPEPAPVAAKPDNKGGKADKAAARPSASPGATSPGAAAPVISGGRRTRARARG